AAPADRWRQGAAAGVAYAAIAILTASLVGATADVTVAGAEFSAAFRASLSWLLLLLPVGAALGAAGGLLAGGGAMAAARPRLAFAAASAVGVAVVTASLPAALAVPSLGDAPSASIGSPAGEGIPGTSAPEAELDPPSEQADPSPSPVEAQDEAPSEPSVPPDSLPDPAFDAVFPTLRQSTDAPIVLPADLPDELGNVAVDADAGDDEYGVLFLYRPTGNILESYVRVNTVGTLTASPEPRDPAFGYVGVTSTETVELPDGTEATLRYMDPSSEGYNQGPFWEGEFENRGHYYTLSVFLPDPSGGIARRALSSVVAVPGGGGGTAEPENPASEDLEAAEEAAGDYYRAAGVQDWAYTYENLDSETGSLFSEDEWYQKNGWLASNGPVIYDILSVEPRDDPGETVAEVAVRITGEDGSSSIRTTYFVYEDGAWKHRFGEEEYDLFMPGVPFDEFVAARGG
ncbi:MAG: hypothetical protein M3R38_29040, partial [Actinomycetota bacterium]|nr:hypothetical protein [Actinomycetota bacterium]